MTTSSFFNHDNPGQQVGPDQGHGHVPSSVGGPVVEVHTVTIQVNFRPVQVLGPRTTGAGIKEAAIAQGVEIQSDFVLSVVEHDGGTKIVRDDEIVVVHKDMDFVAVGPDDNS